MFADGPSLLILLWEQQSPIRGCPGRASVALASILEPAASTNGGRLGRIYFFIVRPGEVASQALKGVKVADIPAYQPTKFIVAVASRLTHP